MIAAGDGSRGGRMEERVKRKARVWVVRGLVGFLVAGALCAWLWLVAVEGASVGVSFFAGLIVSPLIAIVGERVRDRLFHPEVRAVRATSTEQGPWRVSRLLLQNEGSASAREVEAFVDKVLDGGQERENFIPVPLHWTHGQAKEGSAYVSDIHVGQQRLLDLVQVERSSYPGGHSLTLRLCVVKAAGRHPDLSRLIAGRTDLGIALYNASGKTTRLQVQVDWDGKSTEHDVRITRQTTRA
jgi:hypothetical protein